MEQNNSGNPYQAPSVEIVSAAPQGDAAFIAGGKAVPAGNAFRWIASGWSLFVQSPLIWIVNIVILYIMIFAVQLIPFLGGIIANVFWPVFSGGLMMGAHAQRTGRPLEVGDLFAGFKDKAGPLMTVGALYAVAWIVLMVFAGILAVTILGASGAIGALLSGNQAALMGMVGGAGFGLVFVGLLAFVGFILIGLAFWFAPALVVLHDMSPSLAIRTSFFAGIKNIVPIIIFVLIAMVLVPIGFIALIVGLLVVLPLLFAASYAAYRDIFLGE